MTKRTLIISSIILGTVLTISSAQKAEKLPEPAKEKKKPFYLFGSDCDEEGEPIARHGYSAYPGYDGRRALEDLGDGTRKLKRRIQTGKNNINTRGHHENREKLQKIKGFDLTKYSNIDKKKTYRHSVTII